MPELILEAIKFGLFANTITIVLAQGMHIPISHLAFFRGHPGLLLRSLLSVIVLVPIATLLVILLVGPSPAVAVGLAILAACPAAPQMVDNIPKAGGDLDYTASLHLVLGLLSLITTPVTLALLANALNFQASVSPYAIAELVCVSLFLPLIVGMIFFAGFPRAAVSIRGLVAMIGQVINFITIVLVLFVTYQHILQMDLRSYSAMAIMIIVSLGIGHFLAPRQPEERTTLALESAVRHPGLAFLIAVLNFSLEKALPVYIPYMVMLVAICILYIQWRKWTTAGGITKAA